MKRSQLIWSVIFSINAIILGWAGFNLIGAVNYHPSPPKPAKLNKFDYRQKGPGLKLSRYQELLAGGLFFERPPAPPTPQAPQVVFESRLVVYGIVKGQDGRAIVGVGEDPTKTWIVKPGSSVDGEKIVAIGAKYIEVRNESGIGKVWLRE